MITIKNLVKRFGDKTILDDVSLRIEDGEKIAIIGASGCGKSTFLRILLGLVEVDEGEVWVDGLNLAQCSEEQIRQIRLKMGMLFQGSALFDSMSVYENVAFTLVENYGYSLEAAADQVNELLACVGMSGYGDRMPSELSGGQRKRVSLARSIAGHPKYLLYDEPTAGLDPVLSANIETLIVDLNRDLSATTIVVSHEKSTILRTADKIYMLDGGRLLGPETPRQIETSKNPIMRCFINGELRK